MYGIPGLIGKLRPLMHEEGSTNCMLLALYNRWALGKSMSDIVFNKLIGQSSASNHSDSLVRKRSQECAILTKAGSLDKATAKSQLAVLILTTAGCSHGLGNKKRLPHRLHQGQHPNQTYHGYSPIPRCAELNYPPQSIFPGPTRQPRLRASEQGPGTFPSE